jgi:hypothetical protein
MHIWRHWFWALFCAVCFWTVSVLASSSHFARQFPYSRAPQQTTGGFYFQPVGLCEDYPGQDRSQANLDRDFEVIHQSGTKLLRVGIPWLSIEPEPGHYDWSFWDRLVQTAMRNHITLIPYVCYTPEWAASNATNFWRQPPTDPALFGQFMRIIATRYRGKVLSWELWNEPDNPDFWLGTVTQYAQMVQAGAAGVRSADPQINIVLGGFADGTSSFALTLLRTPPIARTVDVVNFHGYNETWNNKLLEDYPGEIATVAQAVAHDHPRPDLWMAEIGYSDLRPGDAPLFYDYQHTAAYQATALFESNVLALSTGRLSLTAWYRINDLPATTDVIGDSVNRYLGMVDLQGHLKPAFFALRFYNRLFGVPTRTFDDGVTITRPPHSQSVVFAFQQQDGRMIITGWLRSPRPGLGQAPDGNATDTRREEITVGLPNKLHSTVTVYDLNGHVISLPRPIKAHTLKIVLVGAQPFIATVLNRK